MAERIRVLYVDDERAFLEMSQTFLEQDGDLSVDTAVSASAALDMFRKNSYDAIVSDYEMPEMNGIELLKRVRAADPNVPFIVFTGKGREEVVIEALNNGANFYLQKGSGPKVLYKELSHVIRQAVQMRRTLTTLAEQEQRYHDLQNANDLIQSVGPDGHFLFVNKKWLDTLGYQEHELPDLTLFDVIHEESLLHCRETFQRVISGENVGIIDAVFRTHDGTRVYVEGMATCRMADGKPQYTRGIFKDVTGRKHTEGALKEREEKFRTIFENSPYPIAINSIPDYTFLEVNAAFLNSSGYTEAEVLGKNPVELGLLSRLDAARLVSRRLLTGRIENVPLALSGKGGRRVHVLFSTIPVTINDKPAVMTVTTETTDMKRVEEELLRKNEELRASEEMFRNIFENSPLGMTLTLPDSRFLLVNPAWASMLGYPEEELVKLSFRDITHPDDLTGDGEGIPELEGGTAPFHCTDTRYIRKDGAILWGSLKATTIRDQDGTLRYYLAQIEDITARKRAEEELRESENTFATLFKSNPVSLTLVSASDGVFVDVNDAFLRNTGYARKEVIGRTSEMLGIFIDSNEYAQMASCLREQRDVRGMEVRTRIKSGEIRNCLFSSRMVMMGGKPHILSTVQDITERKAAESAFQAMVRSMVGTTGLDSLRKITESVRSWLGADCVMVGEIQPDGQTVRVLSMLLDGRAVSDFSYTLKGTPCDHVAEKGFCLYPDNVALLFPESKDLVDLHIRGYMGTPLWNSAGEVIGILCALFRSPVETRPKVQEIMTMIAVKAAAEIERMRIMATLQESEERYRLFIEKFNGIAYLARPDWIPIFFQGAVSEITGYSAEDFKAGHPRWDQVIHPEDMIGIRKRGDTSLRGTPGYSIRSSYRIIRKDGGVRWIDDVIQSFVDKKGELFLAGMLTDITDQKRTSDALRQANRQLNLLTSVTRHDILNQVMVMNGYLSLAKERSADPKVIEYLGQLEAAAHAIQSHIQFTSEYQDVGTHEPQWQELAGLMPSSQAPPGITFTTEPEGAVIFADPMFSRVFTNLLDNSVRHGQQVTAIRMSSRESDEGLKITWEDDGMGIAREEKERIFQRGYGKNTGLGLFLAREILAITGMTIRETGNPGEGARFEIVVPKGSYRFPALSRTA